MKLTPHHIHFVGIAGIGVSALAQVAQARGIRVSGSDPNAVPDHNPAIVRLQAGGASLYTTHSALNLAGDVDLVVTTAAVNETNPEVYAARERGIPVISRAEFLGQVMAAHKGPKIAVAGTHGKTTTTAMIGVMLQAAGLDPTVFVGGEVPELGGNVRVGNENGPFVAEACEAYDSFLYLRPDIAVITNIEADHLDHFGTFQGVLNAFVQFARNVSDESGSGGKIVVCADDPGIQQLTNVLHANGKPPAFHEYGIESAKVVSLAKNIVYKQHPTFVWKNVSITLSVPGQHNVLNALAAATVGGLLQLADTQIADGLAAFRGATRRQEILGEGKLHPDDTGTILVMDDYAHHPTEIRATLDALRSAYPRRRLVAIFQPHLYSRTRDFLDPFAHTLAGADLVIVTDIYAARETPLPGVSAIAIVAAARQANATLPIYFVPDKSAIPAALRDRGLSGDLCVFLGAGDIREQGEAFFHSLEPISTSKIDAKVEERILVEEHESSELTSDIAAESTLMPSFLPARRRVAVLMGGTSSEREISLSTGRMIASALDPQKYDVVAIDTQDLLALQGSPSPPALSSPVAVPQPSSRQSHSAPISNAPADTILQKTDLVFIALHGRGGEDGAVQGLLEVLRLPYTGSGILASALAMDKTMSKRLFRSADIPVAREIVLNRKSLGNFAVENFASNTSAADDPARPELNDPVLNDFVLNNPEPLQQLYGRIETELGGFPVFVKPNAEGSTVGGTLVTEVNALANALTQAFRYDDRVLVETYLRGMEITVGVLGNTGDELQALPVIEIVPRSAFYDYESKYAEGGSDHIIPARLTETQTRQVQQLALRCHTLLGCRGMSRTDFIMTPTGPFVLEVNTIPGMTPTSLLPQAAAHAGIPFPTLLDRIISLAL